MRISDWSSDVCSSDLFFLLVVNIVYAFFDTFGTIHATTRGGPAGSTNTLVYKVFNDGFIGLDLGGSAAQSVVLMVIVVARSEEHTSELQSLMRISYAVFCLKKKKQLQHTVLNLNTHPLT